MVNEQTSIGVTKEDMIFLDEQWRLLSDNLRDGYEKRAKVFEQLSANYSHSKRAYHNLHHIAEMLRLVLRFSDSIENPSVVQFAVWFHDVIYDTKRSDNEDRSASFAASALEELGCPSEQNRMVQELILATKTHGGPHLSSDAEIFLDADLSILGASEEVYTLYSKAIRDEYSWVPQFLYRRKRTEILSNFLSRERIFFNDRMRVLFEKQARRNIESEIASLSRGT